jgi:hypothetical protein
MTFTQAMQLKVGDRITHADTRDAEFGTIADIVKGQLRVNWSKNSGVFLRRESIPMGAVSRLEVLS